MNFKEWMLLESTKSTIVISGVHGNEKAPVIAMKKFINKYNNINNFTFIPEANVSALEKGTRKGADNKDLNRQFCDPLKALEQKIWNQVKGCNLLITLHEWDDDGAFAYYSGPSTKKLAQQFVDIASKEFGIAKPKEKYLKSIKNGLVLDKNTNASSRFNCALETYALKNNIEYITTETPVKENLNKRVKVYLDFLHKLTNK
jgi:hypothetical protein